MTHTTTEATDLGAIERTARNVNTGIWGCAAVLMTGSAWTAYLAYGHLGDNRGLGLASGLAIDLGLCVALVADRRLSAHGLTSRWGRPLRTTTLVMSLVFQTGVSLLAGSYFLAFLHSFLPTLLWVLTEYGQDVQMSLTRLRRDTVGTPSGHDAQQGTSPSLPVPSSPLSLVPPVPGTSLEPTRDPGPLASRDIKRTGTGDLLDLARRLREDLIRDGLPAGRDALRDALTHHTGRDVPERVVRDLITRLNTGTSLRATGGTR